MNIEFQVSGLSKVKIHCLQTVPLKLVTQKTAQRQTHVHECAWQRHLA